MPRGAIEEEDFLNIYITYNKVTEVIEEDFLNIF
jgi:hypothetical protein